jgi:hypothetical protein
MRKIIAIIWMILPWWGGPAAAQAEHLLKIHVHKDVPALTKAQVDQILQQASKVLQNAACNVTFKLDGAIEKFTTSAPKDINTADDLEAVHREPADVKVINSINYCIGQSGSFIGCSWRPEGVLPKTMIVIRRALLVRPILWAHEFGHTTGLPHRVDDEMALMSPCDLQLFNIHVTPDECECFRRGNGGCPMSQLTPACPTQSQ